MQKDVNNDIPNTAVYISRDQSVGGEDGGNLFENCDSQWFPSIGGRRDDRALP